MTPGRAGWRNVVIRGEDELYRQELFEHIDRGLAETVAGEVERDLFLLAAVEAVNNACEHGGPVPGAGIDVKTWFSGGLAAVVVEDGGEGFKPVFRPPAAVRGPRGRGLGLMRANADLLLFNRPGNQVALIKGGFMEATEKAAVREATPGGKVVVIRELGAAVAPGRSLFEPLGEELGRLSEISPRSIYLDLRMVRLMTSREWGLIFAEADEAAVNRIVMFNCGPAVMSAAQQMGVAQRQEPYDKITVLPDLEEAVDMMVREVSTAA
jgi:anti-sigma regulatory factor (Ser/Thr protein kinase)